MKKENPLSKLALKYWTDKGPKMGRHSYTEYYYDLLKNRRKTVKKVLEIGIGRGASLRMWRDFFPNAQIYGADYRPDFLIREDRIKSFLCDQRRGEHLKELIKKTGGDIDLVIEDGSHRPRDQIFTCATLMPFLKKDAIYVIEDVFEPTIVNRFNSYDVEIPKLPYIKRFDNRLVVVRKKKGSSITFFAKMPFKVGPDRHLARVSSMIRAEQIANFIGAKLNPTEGYENDVCIYVKPPWKPGSDIDFKGRKSCLDICDSNGMYELAKKHPEVTIISASDWNYKLLKRILPNKVVNIPEQNCNFERLRRKRKKVTTVGIIGTYKAFEYLPKGIHEELAKRDMKLIEFSKFFTRQDVVDFYMNIDVQIIWRPYFDYRRDILMNPLKMVNSASFGIPTIAYEEPAFHEMKGCYIPVQNLKEFLFHLDNLRSNPILYNKYAKKCIEVGEKYHIEKIAKLYLKLAE